VDWMPTLCGLVSAKPSGDLKWDGQDVWPIVTQQVANPPVRTIYSAAPGFRAQMVRHGDWKLVVTFGATKKAAKANSPTEEVFNLRSDPSESKNLASENSAQLAEMRQRLAEIAQRDRDAVAND